MDRTALAGAVRNRNVLVTLLGFCAFTLVLHGAWLATIVFAYQSGGAAEAGTIGLAVLGPAALLSPAVAVWFDRFAPRIALMLGFGLQAVALIVVAAAIWAEIPKHFVYALLSCFAIVQMSSRPTVSSTLPRVVVDPTELAAANSATGAVETLGLVAGPALAGLVLFLADSPAVSFAVSGAAMALAAIMALGVDVGEHNYVEPDELGENVWSEVAAGLRLLRSEAAPRHLVVVMASLRLTVGVLEVAVVLIAVEHIGRGEASAGILGMAIGLGAVIGSVLSFALVGRRRLTGPIAFGVTCASLPVAVIALSPNFLAVLGLLGVAGLGRPIVEVAGRTLLQGLSSDDMLARIFGMLEGLSLFALALGSAMFSALTVTLGIKPALIVSGLLPCLIVAALFTRLTRIDVDRPEVDSELLALIRTTPLFSPLAAFRIEQMMLNLHRQVWMPAQTIFEKGDYGEVLYVVDRGWVHIDLDDELGLRRGGFFGEIAVLRNQPRMATVRAGSEGAVTYRIHRDVFLDALATAPSSQRRSQRIVGDRLGEAS